MKKFLITIVGPTAIGKTKVAIEVAKYFDAEIISADSRQIFRETNIGTARPSEKELSMVKHHMIACKSVAENYNASMFEIEVIKILNQYYQKHDIMVMAGGSGMYVDAVLKGIDDFPNIDADIRQKYITLLETKGLDYLLDLLKKVDINYYSIVDQKNPKRVLKALEIFEMTGKPYSSQLTNTSKKRTFNAVKIGLNIKREILYDKINQRVDQMVKTGLKDEARSLFDLKNHNALKTVGYREWFDCFEGKLSEAEAITRIKNHTRSYARRQLTWFRRDKEIEWFEPHQIKKIIDYLKIIIPK